MKKLLLVQAVALLALASQANATQVSLVTDISIQSDTSGQVTDSPLGNINVLGTLVKTETLINGNLNTDSQELIFADNALSTTFTLKTETADLNFALIHGLSLSAENSTQVNVSSCSADNAFLQLACTNIVSEFGTFFQSSFIDVQQVQQLFNFELIQNSQTFTLVSGELNVEGSIQLSPVPVPAAAWLFGSAIIGLIARKKA